MRVFICRAAVAASLLLPVAAYAQDADTLAATAKAARATCMENAVTKAKAKKVSPDTLKLILDGACASEVATARDTYSAALDAAVPAGLSIDPLPMKMRYLHSFDADFEASKASIVSKYALGD